MVMTLLVLLCFQYFGCMLCMQDIVGLLVALLQRPHVELLLLAVGFLRRLSVFAVSTVVAYVVCACDTVVVGSCIFAGRIYLHLGECCTSACFPGCLPCPVTTTLQLNK